MAHVQDFPWSLSIIISLALYFLQTLRKPISMAALSLKSPRSPPLHSPLSWVTQFFLEQGEPLNTKDPSKEEVKALQTKRKGTHIDAADSNGATMIRDDQGKLHCGGYEKGPMNKLSKKRPGRLVLPDQCIPMSEFCGTEGRLEKKEFEVEGRDFFLVGKKGRREVMEDGYAVMTDILGDKKQAYFAVIDGHGGHAAAEFVAENLGKNIVKAVENGDEVEQAIRGGYSVTDTEFLSQGVSSGACAASVVVREGALHAANVGDCRVVLSKRGVAHVLTLDHRVNREDERHRIHNSGGYVHCRNGIWRVHGSLAISRAIGDQHLKEWIISEPEIKSIQLTPDCDFLILASDGLWDKVNEQEAVDVVFGDRNPMEACRKLVDISFSRGNMDDVTVMLVNLHNFLPN